MIEYLAPQGSAEWKQARAGCVTASMFAVARSRVGGLTDQQATYVNAIRGGASEAEARTQAGYKAAPRSETLARAIAGHPVGDFSDAAKNYAFRLAVERISGEPLDEGFETWAMRRGHELEPEARMAHEDATGDMVRAVGFVTTDDGKFGCSADGFRLNNSIGCEYKCFVSPEKLRSILLDNDLSDVADQIQGGLWLTGAATWELGLYCPALASISRAFTLRVVPRDEAYIEALEADLVEFERLVCAYEARLRLGDTKAAPAATTPAAEVPADIFG